MFTQSNLDTIISDHWILLFYSRLGPIFQSISLRVLYGFSYNFVILYYSAIFLKRITILIIVIYDIWFVFIVLSLTSINYTLWLSWDWLMLFLYHMDIFMKKILWLNTSFKKKYKGANVTLRFILLYWGSCANEKYETNILRTL